MLQPIERARSWLNTRLQSQQIELLEREGATTEGTLIIDELNRVYRRTGLLDKITRLVHSKLQAIPRTQGEHLRVLELGMRDGSLMQRIAKASRENDLPVELHGVEFQPSLVQLAASRQQAMAFHTAVSPQLREFADQSFDLVYSLFSLHHCNPVQLRELLQASQRIARSLSIHIDLDRSFLGVGAIWLVYSLLGCNQARHDAVLSVRRAYRRDEIMGILEALNLPGNIQRNPDLPLCWILQMPTLETANRP
jgi:SAM-dependent methyltransferase